MEKTRDYWLKNYYHLLEECCTYGMTKRNDHGSFITYRSEKSAWPNMAVLNAPFNAVDLENVIQMHYPITLLLSNTLVEEKDVNALKERFPRQGKWFEMHREVPSEHQLLSSELARVKEVKTEHDFKRWLELVENTLLAEKSFDHGALWDMVQNKVVILVLGLHEGKGVSAAMYHTYEDTLGLYFVVTLPEYRNLGLGSLITKYAFYLSSQLNIKYCVLQATDMGRKVYQRFEFQEVGDVNVFFTLKN